MARSRSLLERFRPAGTPGAAAKPGVPVDRVAELSAELEPVLAMLSETVGEAREIRADGHREAERVQRQAEERARALLAQASRDAEAARSEAAARVTERVEAESAEAVAAAEREAGQVRRRGRQRMPEYVARVLTSVRETATGRAGSEGSAT